MDMIINKIEDEIRVFKTEMADELLFITEGVDVFIDYEIKDREVTVFSDVTTKHLRYGLNTCFDTINLNHDVEIEDVFYNLKHNLLMNIKDAYIEEKFIKSRTIDNNIDFDYEAVYKLLDNADDFKFIDAAKPDIFDMIDMDGIMVDNSFSTFGLNYFKSTKTDIDYLNEDYFNSYISFNNVEELIAAIFRKVVIDDYDYSVYSNIINKLKAISDEEREELNTLYKINYKI